MEWTTSDVMNDTVPMEVTNVNLLSEEEMLFFVYACTAELKDIFEPTWTLSTEYIPWNQAVNHSLSDWEEKNHPTHRIIMVLILKLLHTNSKNLAHSLIPLAGFLTRGTRLYMAHHWERDSHTVYRPSSDAHRHLTKETISLVITKSLQSFVILSSPC